MKFEIGAREIGYSREGEEEEKNGSGEMDWEKKKNEKKKKIIIFINEKSIETIPG